jgi:L-rhamnose mutarotase
MSKRYCLALDLRDNPELIQQYEEHHKAVPSEIIHSIREAGILGMEIYRLQNRLFMIMETEDDFTFERKQKLDAANGEVLAWEKLMWQFQQPLPGAAPGEKWMELHKLFDLKNTK